MLHLVATAATLLAVLIAIVLTAIGARGLLLRSARSRAFLVQDQDGALHRIEGPVHLVPEEIGGTPCDRSWLAERGLAETLGDATVTRHDVEAGDPIAVWGEATVEQRTDGYRDAAVTVIRGTSGCPVLVRSAPRR